MRRLRQEKSKVEDPVVFKALHTLGIPSIPLKLVAGSDTGKPDQVFLIPHGKPLFIEFKFGDFAPEPKQLYWHGILRTLGYDVEVHNSVDAALTSIARKVVAAAVHAQGGKVSSRAWRGSFDVRSRLAEDFHYTRSVQFLKEARRREQNASHRAS